MARKKGRLSRVLVGIMMLMLIVGLAGFGATNFGGGTQSIGTVGEREIDINRYYRSLNEELRALQAQTGQPITLSQARQFGVDQTVLQRLIGAVAVENETANIGLSVGDAEVQRQILQTSAFTGLSGDFDRQSYEFALDNAGMSTTDYENSLRDETASDILRTAVSNGVIAPSGYGDAMLGYIGERRNFSWLELSEASLETEIGDASEEETRAYFDANGDRFVVPAAKRITYVFLSPDHLLDEITVDEETLRALYAERSDIYDVPERRLVERLVFPSIADAAGVGAAIGTGELDFETAVSQRGLTLADVDLGDITQSDLGNAGDAVFTISEPGIVGPIETSLGPALFRVNAILAARNTPFEDAREELSAELSADAARRAVDDQIDEFDDLMAGGATLEQLADETTLELAQIDWRVGDTQGIAAYDGFAEQAFAVTLQDFPQISTLADGSVFALRLDENLDEHPETYENARDDVATAWRNEAIDAALDLMSANLIAQLDVGSTLSSLGYPVQVQTNATRDTFIEGASPDFVERIFASNPGAIVKSTASQRVFIANLTSVLPPDMEDQDIIQLQASLTEALAQSLGQDVLETFVRRLYAEAGISLNQAAINAVHAQFP